MTTLEKLTIIENKVREVCTELIKESEHEGDTGYYGRIELQHILRAIGGEYGVWGDGAICVYDENQKLECGNPWRRVAKFNLSLPLAQQSDEFIDWLYELLK